MTKQETAKLLMLIKATYPSKIPNTDIEAMVDVWTKLLEEYDFATMQGAFMAYCKTERNGFPPSPGQLIEQISAQQEPEESPEELWGLVKRALRNSSYGAEEEFDRLPPLVQKSVGSPDNLRAWGQLPSDEVDTVIHSQFVKTYRIEKDRAKSNAKIPQAVRLVLKQTNLIEEGKDERSFDSEGEASADRVYSLT